MRGGTYLGFAVGIVAGACLASFNSKVKDVVCEAKEKVMQKMEESESVDTEASYAQSSL